MGIFHYSLDILMTKNQFKKINHEYVRKMTLSLRQQVEQLQPEQKCSKSVLGTHCLEHTLVGG